MRRIHGEGDKPRHGRRAKSGLKFNVQQIIFAKTTFRVVWGRAYDLQFCAAPTLILGVLQQLPGLRVRLGGQAATRLVRAGYPKGRSESRSESGWEVPTVKLPKQRVCNSESPPGSTARGAQCPTQGQLASRPAGPRASNPASPSFLRRPGPARGLASQLHAPGH